MELSETDKYRIAFGELVEKFSRLESMIDRLLSSFIGGKVGHIIVCELSIRQKIDLLMSLYRFEMSQIKDVPPKIIDKQIYLFDLLLRKIKTACDARNTIIHSYWFGGGYRIKATAKYKSGYEIEEENVPLEKITKLSENTNVYGAMLSNIQANGLFAIQEQSSFYPYIKPDTTPKSKSRTKRQKKQTR